MLKHRRRRASAARVLKKKSKLSNLQLIKYGIRSRVARKGLLGGVIQTIGVGVEEAFSFILSWTLKLIIFYPLVLGSRFIKLIAKALTEKKVDTRLS